MKKSKLGRLPVLAASNDDVAWIRRQPDMQWLMKAEMLEFCNEKILSVSFYNRDDLCQGFLNPRYRTFFTHDEYITQDMNAETIQWRTGTREHIMYEWYNRYTGTASDKDDRIICDFFREPEKEIVIGRPVRLIDEFQRNILMKKLEARHKRIMQRIDEEMQGITTVPAEFEDWIDKSIMEYSRYFFYQYKRGKTEEGICSWCGKKGRIQSRNIRYRKPVTCPHCGKILTALSVGRMPAQIHDCANAAMIQKVDGKLVIRYFRVHKNYSKSEPGKCIPEMYEYVRQIYKDGTWKEYEWDYFKSTRKIRWCDSRRRFDAGKAVLWSDGVDEILRDTPYAYTALEEYASHRADHFFDVWFYLEESEKYPWIEKLVKCGFWKLAEDSTEYYSQVRSNEMLDDKKGKLYQILKLSHSYFSILPRDISPYELRFYQQCFRHGIKPEPAFFAMCRKNRIHHTEILECLECAPVGRIVGYLTKQINLMGKTDFLQTDMDNLIRNWKDYLGWCRELEYDLHDKYYLMPENLHEAHDRVYEEYMIHIDKIREEKRRKAAKKATKRLKKFSRLVGEISNAKMQIIVPRNAEEIVEEGRTLHHCVGGYIQQVADETTMILFLRKKDKPGKPYRTLEWKDNKFVQCQGKGNQEKNGEEITDFLDFARKKLIERLDKKPAA